MPPVVSGISASVAHGQNLTIHGSGFGTKTNAAPVIWDDGSGPGDIRQAGNGSGAWDDGWPKNTVNPEFSTQRRSGGWRGVLPPHTRVGRYIAGCHGEGQNDSTKGQNVIFWKSITASPSVTPLDLYLSFWQQIDPLWSFGGDNNFKCLAYSAGNGFPTARPHIWFAYAGHFPESITDIPKWAIAAEENGTDDFLMQSGSLFYAYASGPPAALSPFGQWIKYEVVCKMGSSGFIRIYENGKQEFGYTGRTDVHAATTRKIGVGAYARRYNQPSNYRYFSDVYLDSSHARVILGNAPVLADCTTREVQIPSAWADGELAIRVNAGIIADGSQAYLFVVDSSNAPSEGFAVDIVEQSVGTAPIIVSPLSVFGVVGETCTYDIEASGATSHTASPLPDGVSANSSTGQMSGTYEESAQTQTQISASNSFGTDIKTLVFNIVEAAGGDGVNIGTTQSKIGSSLSIAVGAEGVPAGKTIFVVLGYRGAASTEEAAPTASDAINGAYALDAFGQTLTGGGNLALLRYSNNSALSQGDIITITVAEDGLAKAATACYVDELLLTTPLDQLSVVGSTAASSSAATGNVTTSTDAQFMLGAVAITRDDRTITQDTDYESTIDGAETSGDDTDSNIVVFPGHRLITASETNNYAVTLDGNSGWVAVLATYKQATTPVITNDLMVDGTLGTPFTVTLTATNSPTSFHVSGLPPATGWSFSVDEISVPADVVGTFAMIVWATNATGAGQQETLYITVNTVAPDPPSAPGAIRIRGFAGARLRLR